MVPEARAPDGRSCCGFSPLVLAVSSRGQGWERTGSRVFLWESHPHDLLRLPPNGPSANTITLGPQSMNWGWGDTDVQPVQSGGVARFLPRKSLLALL